MLLIIIITTLFIELAEMAPLLPPGLHNHGSSGCELGLMSISRRQSFYNGGIDFKIIFANTIDPKVCGGLTVDLKLRYFNDSDETENGTILAKTQCEPNPLSSDARTISCGAPNIKELLTGEEIAALSGNQSYGVIVVEPYNQLFGCERSADNPKNRICYSIAVHGAEYDDRDIMFTHPISNAMVASSVRSQQSLRYYPNPMAQQAVFTVSTGIVDISGSGFVGDNVAALSRLYTVNVVNQIDGSNSTCSVNFSEATNEKISCKITNAEGLPTDTSAKIVTQVVAGNWQVEIPTTVK